ncbi:hypothetical protein NHX12_029257 [Muraenolepis orangiensis]|uniref:Reverse transcriptase domain-containing protein n=1 Tax=Muraenolepis orangiensis TaxID=630683 RepID=A0A9Q0EHI2_9TELE|nr:hypothetical protein NHX12_029257 [Muraenolepis orangiensis]
MSTHSLLWDIMSGWSAGLSSSHQLRRDRSSAVSCLCPRVSACSFIPDRERIAPRRLPRPSGSGSPRDASPSLRERIAPRRLPVPQGANRPETPPPSLRERIAPRRLPPSLRERIAPRRLPVPQGVDRPAGQQRVVERLCWPPGSRWVMEEQESPCGLERPTLSAYADDVSIFVSSQRDVQCLQDTLSLYERASSARFNWAKSRALLLGRWREQVVPSLPGGLQWETEGLKDLGVFLGTEAFRA